jgi:hypothetical protein
MIKKTAIGFVCFASAQLIPCATSADTGTTALLHTSGDANASLLVAPVIRLESFSLYTFARYALERPVHPERGWLDESRWSDLSAGAGLALAASQQLDLFTEWNVTRRKLIGPDNPYVDDPYRQYQFVTGLRWSF